MPVSPPARLCGAARHVEAVLGRELPGVVRLTLAGGRVTYASGIEGLD